MAPLFLDTSALVRRYDATEPGAGRVRQLLDPSAGHVIIISRLTPLEVASALNRKLRERTIDEAARDRLWRLFRFHRRDQYRVIALDEESCLLAEQLLFQHRLRAYDALQIAAARRAASLLADIAPDFRFCTADRAQAEAARREAIETELIT